MGALSNSGVGSVVAAMSKMADENIRKKEAARNGCVVKLVVTLVGVGDVVDVEFEVPNLNTK
jgi:hypothetical protein